MAGGKSTYLEKSLINQVLGGVTLGLAAPTTVYAALFTVVPADAGTGGTEVSAGGYARAVITNNTTNWPAATGGGPSTKANGGSITFNAASADWTGITAWGIYDQLTVGNLLYFGSFASTQSVSSGQTASWAAGGITITED